MFSGSLFAVGVSLFFAGMFRIGAGDAKRGDLAIVLLGASFIVLAVVMITRGVR